MSRKLVEQLYDLFHDDANSATDIGYATRFTISNVGLSKEDFLAKWDGDNTDREEAAKVEAHRKAKVLNDFRDAFGVEGDAIANIVGTAAVAAANSFKNPATAEEANAGDPDVGADTETN